MNKSTLLLSGVLLCASATSTYAVLSQAELIKQVDIIGRTTFPFNKEYLITYFNPDNVIKWNMIMNHVNAFVKKNITADKVLLTTMEQLHNISFAISNAFLKVEPHIMEVVDHGVKRITIENSVQVLKDASTSMESVMKSLNKTYLTLGNKKSASVMKSVAHILARTISKSINDLELELRHLK